MPSEKLGIKLVVAENNGMRRFLYPLRTKLPSIYYRLAGKLALADPNGNLIPSFVASGGIDGGVYCSFATSLAPYETQEFHLVRPDDISQVPVPDPLNITASGAGFVSTQEKVAFKINEVGLPDSVIYEGQEHLAGPVSIQVNGSVLSLENPPPIIRKTARSSMLAAQFNRSGLYESFLPKRVKGATLTQLTACKSWVRIQHTLTDPQPNSTLRLTLPLTVTSPVQTCDFGVGNGAYGKIQPGIIDSISWENDLSPESSSMRWIIASERNNSDPRIDYTGEIKPKHNAASRFWLHWNEPTKAFALAVTDIPPGCERLGLRLDSHGICTIDFSWIAKIANPATFGVCCHFLNAIPPIAAATNPASILLPPKVSIVKL